MATYIHTHGLNGNQYDYQRSIITDKISVTNDTHDSSVAVIKDGKFVSFVEEERFSRNKHSSNRYPFKALKFVLKNMDFNDNIKLSCLSDTRYKNFETTNALKQYYPLLQFYSHKRTPHHLDHAYCTFYNSGFEHSAVLIIDGTGNDEDSITLYKVEKNKPFIQLKKYSDIISPGLFYTYATNYIGYNEFDNGKLMGLSAYGSVDTSYDLYTITNTIKANSLIDKNWNSTFTKYFYPWHCNKPINKNDTETIGSKYDINIIHYANFSATIQYWFNKVVLFVLHELKNMCPEETNLCLCGGCFLNGIVNNLIIKEGLFEHYFCPPWTDDSGTSIGKGYISSEQNGEILISEKVTNPFYGTEILDSEVEKIKDIKQVSFNDIVEMIQQGNIIGWVQGKSEMGPRALGHRSIIADPTNRENFYKINTLIKHREDWRPLSPIVPEELFDMLFDVEYNHDLFEFMLRITTIKQEWKKKIPAVCHVDGTTRPQFLKKEINSELYNIMIQLWNKYKIPCLINTSLNDRGEPIVETIQDALNFFNKTPDLDCLIFNGKYILKRN